jgi:HD-like signal output (HDOD) protein
MTTAEPTRKVNTLEVLLADLSPTLSLLPRIERIINKEEPTLEDILEVCSHDPKLLGKLTRRAGFNGTETDFARDVLFKKGLGFLKSLAIRSMNQEIFEVEMLNSDLNPSVLKKRSVILARFIKSFSDDLQVDPDEAYLAGLFYNYDYVCYEILQAQQDEQLASFDENAEHYGLVASQALASFGFKSVVTDAVEDAKKEFFHTRLPFAHALLRIANETLANTEQSSVSIGRGPNPDRDLVDATGMRVRKIFAILKDISRNYSV